MTNPPYEALGEVSQSSIFHNLFVAQHYESNKIIHECGSNNEKMEDGIPSIPRNVKILETNSIEREKRKIERDCGVCRY